MDPEDIVESLTAEDFALLNKISEPKVFVRAACTAFGWTLDQVAAAIEAALSLEAPPRRNVDNWVAGKGAHPARMQALRNLVAAAKTPLELHRFMAVLREHA